MGWFTRKKYPEFWQQYRASFSSAQQQDIHKVRFVVFDTETTGLHTEKDRILSIGAVAVFDLKIKVSDHFECYVEQEHFDRQSVKIHGLLKKGQLSKISEEEAITSFLDYIKNAVLVAHHAAFDIAMINAALKRMHLPKLKNKVLDTGQLFKKAQMDKTNTNYSLDNLSKKFNIAQHDRHTASGDAFITSLLFLKIIALLRKRKINKLSELTRSHQRIGLM